MFLIFYMVCITSVEVFSNYAYYEVTAFNTHERYFLYNMQQMFDCMYFLNQVTNEAATTMEVVVDPSCTESFEETLLKYDIVYSCVKRLPKEYDRIDKNKDVSQTFLNWNEILLWVENELKENSALTKTVIAKTFEYRDIFVLKVSTEQTGKKMAVFIVAGEEGRDWLSSALLLNYINRILKSVNSAESLLNFFDMYFIPVLNPDGFAYSKEKDRMWTKNRKLIQPPQTCAQNSTAIGVNIDRNWYSETSASKFACDSIYAGSQALSEEETQSLSYILNSIALKLLTVISLRGFGNLITLPYSDDKEQSTNHNIVMEIMKHVSAVLKIQFNKSYPVGTTADYFYNFSGNMPDWVKMNLNIPIVFTVHMQHKKFLPEGLHILPLLEQFESLLNLTLVISKEVYGPLYNTQNVNVPCFHLLINMVFFSIFN